MTEENFLMTKIMKMRDKFLLAHHINVNFDEWFLTLEQNFQAKNFNFCFYNLACHKLSPNNFSCGEKICSKWQFSKKIAHEKFLTTKIMKITNKFLYSYHWNENFSEHFLSLWQKNSQIQMTWYFDERFLEDEHGFSSQEVHFSFPNLTLGEFVTELIVRRKKQVISKLNLM